MAQRKAIIEGQEFLVDEDVKMGDFLPADASSIIDQKTGRELTRAEYENMPAAGSNVRANFQKLEKG